MKLRDIFTLFTLSVIVKGAWWAAAVQPLILGLGAILSSIDLDVLYEEPTEWLSYFKSEKIK